MDDRFAGFRVNKQGDSDSACGLYCVLSAAQHVFRADYLELERGTFMVSWRSARDKGGSLWAARLSAA